MLYIIIKYSSYIQVVFYFIIFITLLSFHSKTVKPNKCILLNSNIQNNENENKMLLMMKTSL